MILADKIIYLRKKSGWSQEELAEKLGVTRQSVSKWEGAQSVPDLERILQLGKVFGVSTDYLLKDEIEEEEKVSVSEETNGVKRVTMKEASEFLAYKYDSAKWIALAVLMYVLSPVCLLMLGAASEDGTVSENFAGGFGMTVMLLIIAAATALCIFISSRGEKYKYLEEETFETEYGVAGMAEDRREKQSESCRRINIAGVCLCIVAVVPLFVGVIFSEETLFLVGMLSLLFALVGIGSALCTYAEVKKSAVDMLLQEGDYTLERKKNKGVRGAVTAVYWCTVTAVFLGWTFLGDPETSWVVWAIGGVLFGGVAAVSSALNKRNIK